MLFRDLLKVMPKNTDIEVFVLPKNKNKAVTRIYNTSKVPLKLAKYEVNYVGYGISHIDINKSMYVADISECPLKHEYNVYRDLAYMLIQDAYDEHGDNLLEYMDTKYKLDRVQRKTLAKLLNELYGQQ